MENKTLRKNKIIHLINTNSHNNYTINANKFNISTKQFKDNSNQTLSLKDLINFDKLKNTNKKNIKLISESNFNIHTININKNILEKIKLNSNLNNIHKNKSIFQNNNLTNSHQTYLTLTRDNIKLRKGKLLKISKLFQNTNHNYYIESNLNRFYYSENREKNKQKIIPKIKQDKNNKYNNFSCQSYENFENKNKYKKRNDKIKLNENLIPIHSEKIIQYTENYFHLPSKSKSPLSDMSELIPDIRRKKRINNYLLFEMNEYYKKRNTHFKFKL